MCLSLQNTSSVGVHDVVQDNSPGQMTMEEPLPHKGNTHHYMHGHTCVIYYTCVIIDKVEKTDLQHGGGDEIIVIYSEIKEEVAPGVGEKVKEAAQTTDEKDEGELANQSNKEEMDEEESECMHVF